MSKAKVHYLTLPRPIARDEFDGMVADIADGEAEAEDVARETVIRLAFVTASRVKAYDRGDQQEFTQVWLAEQAGVEDAQDVDVTALPTQTFRTFSALWQAADILGALVPEECEGWQPPEDPADWAEVEDYIFQPALIKAWELNPQWRIQAGVGDTSGN